MCERPKVIGIVDVECIEALGILYQLIAIGRVIGTHFNLLTLQEDRAELASIGFGEGIAIEILFQHLCFTEDSATRNKRAVVQLSQFRLDFTYNFESFLFCFLKLSFFKSKKS